MDYDYDAALARIKAVTGARTQVELARILEIRQPTVADSKKRRRIPADWRLTLFEKLGVNPTWVLTGEGPQYLKAESGGADPGKPVNPAFLDSPSARTVVVPVHGMRVNGPGERPAPEGKLALPASHARPGILILRCDTGAFAPVIVQGAYVGIDEQDRVPTAGEIFAVRVTPGNILIRQLFYDGVRRCFLLRPASADQLDLSVPPEELEKGMLGRVAWVLQRL